MGILDPVKPSILAVRIISNVDRGFAEKLGLGDNHRALGLITCDIDDALYVSLDEATKSRLVTEIDEDLRAADAAIAQLPDSSRAAVRTAHLLFGELNDRIAATPARDLARTRVRVPDARKAVLVARAFLREDVSVPGIGAGRPARPVAGGTR